MKRYLFLLSFTVLLVLQSAEKTFAQCTSIPASDLCANAPDICDLNGYCGTTSGYTTGTPTTLCGFSIENNSFISFIALQTTVSFTATVGTCSNNNGIQMVVLQTTDCNTFNIVSNCANSIATSAVITASGLIPGQQYLLMVDGYAGDICTYTINSAVGVGTCCPVVPNAGTDVEICSGDSTTLTATGGISYFWTPGNFTTPSITVSPLSTTKYIVEVSNDTCSKLDSVMVFVNPLPNVDAGSPASICPGDSAFLSATTLSNLSYNAPLSFDNPIRYPINNLDTTYSPITVSGVSGSVNASSIVSVCLDLTHPSDGDLDIFLICPDGTQLELSTDNGGTGDNYTSTCFRPTATQQITGMSAPFSGNYLPEAIGGFSGLTGCSANGTWQLAVYDDASGNIGSIERWSITINNPVNDTAMTNLWSPSTGLSATNINNPIAFPTVTTTYYLTGTNSKGCISVDSTIVTVNTLPNVNAGADDTICAGSTVSLNGSGGTTYGWSPSAGLSDSTIANPVAAPLVTTTYFLTGTSAQGCVNSDSVTIIVNAYPVLNAGTDKNICSGDSVQLLANGGTNYSWSPATGLNNTSIANPMASPSSTISYTVASNNFGCISYDSITVNVDFVTADAGNDTSICAGSIASLNASGGTSYSWLPATGLSSDIVSDPDAMPSSTTTYTVTATTGQCTATDSIVITVNQLPVITLSNDATICLGDTTALTASGAASYSWSPSNGLNNPGIQNPLAAPAITTAYSVTGTDVNGCSSSDVVTIFINPLPIINAGSDVSICQGSPVTLNATGSSNLSWSPSAGLSSTVSQTPVANPATTTNYVVTATSASGCTDKDTVIVTVYNSLLNTTTNSVNASCFGSANGSATLTVSGGTGSYNYSWFPGGYNSASVNNLAAGTYTVTIIDAVTTCRDTSLIVINQPADFSTSTSTANATCGDANGLATVNVSGPSTYTYSWNTIPSQASQSAINLEAGEYVVTVSDAFNCSKTDTAIIYSIDEMNASFTPSVTEGISPLNVFFTNNSNGATNYVWTFGDAQSSTAFEPSHTFVGSGSYNVTLIASNTNCIDTAEYVIIVEENLEYDLPNVFTPNGDQKNDIFTLDGSGMKDFNGVIFNRWGKRIFEWNDPKGGWNGDNQPDGVYYYTIEFKIDSGELKTLTGFVNLLR